MVAAWVALAATVAGCSVFAPSKRPVPFEPPTARRLAPSDDPAGFTQPGMPSGVPVTSDVGMRPPQNILVMSGGGSFGAFTAGVLAGWTKSGTRPEFDVVTGISTGSLLAPFAFIGPDYDHRAKHFYTNTKAEDIFTVRSWLTLPFRSSVASSAPLRRLIEAEIDQTLMERIAAEHRKGRRLYVGTTNIDTKRLAVWDLGAIACRPCPEGCTLFRDVLLASCSIPGMFPPVTFEIDVDGKQATEMHVDGGVSAQLFCPSAVFSAAATRQHEGANLYIVVAGKLYPDAKAVRERVLPVLAATTSSHVYSHRRGELTNMYGLARSAGMRYHLSAVRQEFRTADLAIKFDQQEMGRLYQEGFERGGSPQSWMATPPELAPGDGDYIRNGLHLRPAGRTDAVGEVVSSQLSVVSQTARRRTAVGRLVAGLADN
ncbi:MAG TPA: patatin-like phospholipase family protein [Gemmataceae bacterium]|nr:patatin-like phospholipase family protein [Gemmataceae bacterium]